jgi:hypothetical protein
MASLLGLGPSFHRWSVATGGKLVGQRHDIARSQMLALTARCEKCGGLRLPKQMQPGLLYPYALATGVGTFFLFLIATLDAWVH